MSYFEFGLWLCEIKKSKEARNEERHENWNVDIGKKTPSGSGRGQGKANDGIWLW